MDLRLGSVSTLGGTLAKASILTLGLLVVQFGTPRPALAQAAASAIVTGTVRSTDATAIGRASVLLRGNGPTRSTITDGSGRFEIGGLVPGTYVVEASAKGYSTLSDRTVEVGPGSTTTLALTLNKAQVSSLAVIGSVTVNGSSTLSTAPAPSLEINTQPYAQQGVTRTSDILQDQLSTTVYPVIGGGLNAPAVVALRGPDPAETLVDVDGHQVNNGSTGDFDLSLLDPADLQNVQVIYGIAPSSLFGPNTLGGALNVITLEPTPQEHTLLRFTGGSYDTYGETLDATGTDDRLGYAFSFHRVTSGGQLFDYSIPTNNGVGDAPIGNDMDASSMIGKLRYTFGNGAFVGVTFRDQPVYRDLSATLSSVQTPADGASGPGDAYSNYSGSSILSIDSAYGLDAQAPLGRPNAEGTVATTAIYRHQTSLVSQSVFGPAAGTSPYLYNDRDLIGDDTLEIDHVLPHGLLALKGALTDEGLLTDFVPGVIFADSAAASPLAAIPTVGGLGARGLMQASTASGTPTASEQFLAQTQRWLGLMYHDDPTSKLHYSFAEYYSDYSTFGKSFDPRFGFVWTPTADSSFRLSAGNTFQSPQLPTFIVPPVLPPPVDGYVNIGNPNATAERATSYDIGYEHLFRLSQLLHGPQQVHLALDVYRTDLHNGVATYFSPTPCQAGVDYGNNPPCLSYPVNVTQEEYEGVEVRGDVELRPHTVLRASYDVDSVFTKSYPTTSADDVPLYEQSLGVPLHKYNLTLEEDKGYGLAYYAGLLYEGAYNELNLPPFATLRAGVTWHLRDFDLGAYGTNLTNVYSFPLTRVGGGVLYGGLSGPVPTNAIPLPGRQIIISLSRHT